MKINKFKYVCNLCQKQNDYSSTIGLSLKDGVVDYSSSFGGSVHICISCWTQIEKIQNRLKETAKQMGI